MNQKNTLFDRMVIRIKNNRVAASILVFGVVVIALASFIGSVKTLFSISQNDQPETISDTSDEPSTTLESQPGAARITLAQLSLEYTPEVFVESAEKQDLHALRLFLTAGMDPNAKNKHGDTALMHAAGDNNIPIMEALLKAKADINITNRRGYTTLAWSKNENALRRLLDSGANINSINNAFVDLSESGRIASLRMLLVEGAEINKVGENSLLAAAGSTVIGIPEQQLVNTVRFLLDRGVDVNTQSKEGWTALLLAIINERTSMAEFLLERGADINAKCICSGFLNGGWSALMMSVTEGLNKIVDILLTKGAHVNEINNDGKTALMIAVGSFSDANIKTVQALLDSGAHVNAKDNKGRTALSIARRQGHSDFVLLLESALNQ